MATGYYLRLEQFEGPLDLLLHLIRVNEIDIFNIDIFLLTTQYLNHLRVMEFDDLADAGDFIEMASSLVEIKSRMLLPTESIKASSEEVGEDDPLRSLQDRLIEYETFRKASEFFEAIPQLGVEIQSNHEWQRLVPLYEDIEGPLKGDSAALVILYEQILRDLKERKPEMIVEAVTHRVGVKETVDRLISVLEAVKFAIFQSFYREFESRYELVVSILAVLEMSRWGQAKVYQEELNGPLWVYRPDFDEELLPAKRLQGVPAEAAAVMEKEVLS